MAAAMKLSATCASFAPKTVPPRAELGRTPTGDAKRAWRKFAKPPQASRNIACSRFARLTIPTSLPSFTTGTRLMPFFFEHGGNLPERRFGRHGQNFGCHHVNDVVRMRLHELIPKRCICRQKLEPPRAVTQGMRFDPPLLTPTAVGNRSRPG